MKSILMIALLVVATSSCNSSNKQTNKNEGHSTPTPKASGNTGESSAAANGQADVLSELIAIEQRWKTAKYKGDTATLETIFADEFTNVAENGKTYTKAEWIALWKRGDPTIKSWEMSDERLESLEGNKATITFTNTLKNKKSRTSRTKDMDTFIKRDGRWQVIASQSTKIS